MERARARGAAARARAGGAAARDDRDSRRQRRQGYRRWQVKDGSDNLVSGKVVYRRWQAADGSDNLVSGKAVYRRWQAADGSDNLGSGKAFFFYNFPEACRAEDLWFHFQKFGRVVDVYVPGRRDKRGNRFGFVRMIGVQSEQEMVRKLNDLWIGSYKVRVKMAEARRRQISGVRRAPRVVAERNSELRLDRMVQPGHSYAQAVVGLRPQIREPPSNAGPVHAKVGQIVETEAVGSSGKDVVGLGLVENIAGQSKADVVEFTPTKEEIKWLEGSMVAEVKSLTLISNIQARLDVDGGAITLLPLGGRRVLLIEQVSGCLVDYTQQNKDLFDLWFESVQPWTLANPVSCRLVWLRISGIPLKAWCDRCFQLLGELVGDVVRIHEDTTNKIILGDGRVLLLCYEKSKIFQTVSLKVEDQMYEVEMSEEEWRSDRDWWLSDGDRRCESETESEYSFRSNGSEDADLIHVAKSGGNEDIFDEEMLEKDVDSNSNKNSASDGSDSMVSETEDIEDGYGEHNDCNGLAKDKRSGLDEAYGPDAKLSPKRARDGNDIRPAAEHEHVLTPVQNLDNRGAMGKRRKHILECYPQDLAEIGDKSTQWVTARTKQRQRRWKQAQQEVPMTVGESISLSDGCIANRNRVIQREMSLLEVRRMISVGKRLGVQLQGNEEEIQSRLLQLEESEVVKEQGREEA
ncbi:hypothetical protein SLE2022_082060 [Rubroshorea leprosula]